jgi:hypothetical protein
VPRLAIARRANSSWAKTVEASSSPAGALIVEGDQEDPAAVRRMKGSTILQFYGNVIK